MMDALTIFMPPAARNLFVKRFLDLQKSLIIYKAVESLV
jgi:hypothetical protein